MSVPDGMKPERCWPAEHSQCLTQKGPCPSIYLLMSLIFHPLCLAAGSVSPLFCCLLLLDWMKLKHIQEFVNFKLCDVYKAQGKRTYHATNRFH